MLLVEFADLGIVSERLGLLNVVLLSYNWM